MRKCKQLLKVRISCLNLAVHLHGFGTHDIFSAKYWYTMIFTSGLFLGDRDVAQTITVAKRDTLSGTEIQLPGSTSRCDSDK